MTTELFENYAIVNDIVSVKEIESLGYNENTDVAAVVICCDKEFQIDEADKNYLKNGRFLTFIYSPDFSSFSAEFLMHFDMRLSGNEYFINPEIFKEININRYRLLCGEKDTYNLISYFTEKNASVYKSKLVRNVGSIDDVKKYCEILFKDKTHSEINCLVKCLTTARTGDIQSVFGQESVNFYEMIRQKVQGS